MDDAWASLNAQSFIISSTLSFLGNDGDFTFHSFNFQSTCSELNSWWESDATLNLMLGVDIYFKFV